MRDSLDLFLQATRDHRRNPAVVDHSEVISYEELLCRTERLAHAIGRADCAHPRVAIVLPQGSWAYAAMFAALMAGGVYAPVNLDHPPDRRRQVLSQFGPDVAIAMSDSDLDGLGLPEESLIISITNLDGKRRRVPAPPADLAYVMFTSGSTGKPKGVMISRSALAHYTDWAHRAMAVTPDDRWSQHPNVAFDLSVLDIYGALCAGAALYPLTHRTDRLFPATAIRRNRLTVWNSVPSVIDLMRRSKQLDGKYFESLRLITFCGEPLLKQHLDDIFAARADLLVHNTYGPTEATVSATLIRLRSQSYAKHCASSVALGAPIEGMRIILEGGDTDEEGEIVIAGPQVARGYWRDEKRTADAFGARTIDGTEYPSYRTGDWARRCGEDLYFVSRIDRQIKRQGNRIELGDIDAAFRDAGAEVACTVYTAGKLVSFLEDIDPAALPVIKRRIGKLLPAYCVPDEIRHVDQLPRNANDKIDTGMLEKIVASDGI